MTEVSPEERLISVLADRLSGDRHVAVGAASPIPGAAALIAQAEAAAQGRRMHVTILHSRLDNRFTDGARELFDAAAQGRINSFFLGGVQIDGSANINLVGVGEYPQVRRRFPGSFGSGLMAFVVPNLILFREEHSPRTLVEKVDFVSAPGTSDPGVYRPGGPKALVTGRCVFSFNGERFRLESVHPGETPDRIAEMTGFAFDPGTPHETPGPTPERLRLIRQTIAPRIATFYPEFARRQWGVAA